MEKSPTSFSNHQYAYHAFRIDDACPGYLDQIRPPNEGIVLNLTTNSVRTLFPHRVSHVLRSLDCQSGPLTPSRCSAGHEQARQNLLRNHINFPPNQTLVRRTLQIFPTCRAEFSRSSIPTVPTTIPFASKRCSNLFRSVSRPS